MTTDAPCRVLVVDDHPIVRTGIVALLSEEPAVEVVGQTGDGLEALELTERLAPDVVVLDLLLPGLSGLEVNRRIAGKVRVLVLTLHADEAYAARVVRDGARGFALKDAHPNEIRRAFRAVRAGQVYLPAVLGDAGAPLDPWDRLTDREREVVHLVGEGRTHADVGERLGISARTAEVHRANAFRKLNLANSVELVRFLVRRGLLSATD